MGTESRYEAFEIELWERISLLLPSVEDQASFRDCREIGEHEAGLWMLTQRLLEDGVPIDDRARAEIEVLAEYLGERYARHEEIASCVRVLDQTPTVRVLPDNHAEAGSADADFAGHTIVPWLECLRCGRVLSRAHQKRPWAEFVFVSAAEYYIIQFPRQSATDPRRVFDRDELYEAWESLLACD